jgi:hypothetical protein
MSRAHLFRGTLALLIITGFALAQEPKKPADKPAVKPVEVKPAAPAKPGEKPAGEQMSAEDAAKMAKYMAYGTPGPEHALLKPLVGNFSCDMKMIEEPGAAPQASSGMVKREWIMGDRYISEHVESTFMGMPFEGRGIVGYDNGNKKYFFTWIDSMSTGMMTATGTASGKVVTFEGEHYCPDQGKNIWSKSVMDVSNNDRQTFKMYSKDKSGKEFLNFDMTCTRK